jgi:hypothetical protein
VFGYFGWSLVWSLRGEFRRSTRVAKTGAAAVAKDTAA